MGTWRQSGGSNRELVGPENSETAAVTEGVYSILSSKGGYRTMRRLFTCGAIVGMTALTACGGSAGGNQVGQPAEASSEAATTVKATVSDFKTELDQASPVPGKIAFAVTGGGPSSHELVAFKTDLAEDQLPVKAEDHNVDETDGTVKHFSP